MEQEDWDSGRPTSLRSKYRKYKNLERDIDISVPPESLSTEELQYICDSLFRALLLRHHVRDTHYKDQVDEGHEIRLKRVGEYLQHIQAELSRRLETPKTDPEPEPIKHPAQPTSSRQQRRKQQREAKQTKNIDMMLAVEKLAFQFAIDLEAAIIRMGENAFRKKFGDIGPSLFNVAMQCAQQLASMSVMTHRMISGKTKSYEARLTDIFCPPPLYHCQGNFGSPGVINTGKKYIGFNHNILYSLIVALTSFDLSIDDDTSDYILNIEVGHGQLGIEEFKKSIELILPCVKGGTSYFIDSMNHRLERCKKDMDKPFPRIDADFCRHIVDSGIQNWTMCHLGNEKYIYIADNFLSKPVSLPETKHCARAIFFVIIDSARYEEWLIKHSPEYQCWQAVQAHVMYHLNVIPMVVN